MVVILSHVLYNRGPHFTIRADWAERPTCAAPPLAPQQSRPSYPVIVFVSDTYFDL